MRRLAGDRATTTTGAPRTAAPAASGGLVDHAHGVTKGDFALGEDVGAQTAAVDEATQYARHREPLGSAQGSHSRRPMHSTSPIMKRRPTSGLSRIPRVTMLRRASAASIRPRSSSASASTSVSARPTFGPEENEPVPAA
jgi:hypothetical protein